MSGMHPRWWEAVCGALGDLGVGVTVGVAERFLYVNPAFCAITGYAPEELTSIAPVNLIAPEDRRAAPEHVERSPVVEPLPDFSRPVRLLRQDGTRITVEGAAQVVELEDQRQLVAVVRDITAQAEQARWASEERFRSLMDGIQDYACFLLDTEGRVVSWNAGAERLQGYRVEEVTGHHFSRFLPREEAAEANRALDIAAGAGSYIGEGWCLRKDGSAFWASITITALRANHDALWGFTVLVHDITERRLAQEALGRAHREERAWRERLETLQSGVLEAQERERRHISRELHDEIGQTLTALKLTLDRLERGPAERRPALVAEARRAVGEMAAQVQDLSLGLRPAMLDDLGLLPALLWLLDRYTTHTGVEVDFEHEGLEARLPSQVEIAAYRIVQETLTNVARHAGVERASLSCRVGEDGLAIAVADEGVGFHPEEALGAGLVGMRERARLVGGWLSVESGPHAGTRVLARLPLIPNP